MCLASIGRCQGDTSSRPFADVRPDVAIVVRKHSTGADLIEATVLNPEYPAEILQRQMQEIGLQLGAQLNGLELHQSQIDPDNTSLTFLKATCGTFGLWNKDTGVVKLDALVRSFLGAQEPYTVKGMSVLLAGMRPSATTIRKLDNKGVSLEATESELGVEYRIGIKSQDPNDIVIPAGKVEPSVPKNPSKDHEGPPVFAWAAIGVSGLAVGVLVYLSLLRGRRPAAP